MVIAGSSGNLLFPGTCVIKFLKICTKSVYFLCACITGVITCLDYMKEFPELTQMLFTE